MGRVMSEYVDELLVRGILEKGQLSELLRFRNPETTLYLYEKASQLREQVFHEHVTVLGRILLSNYCKNECKMCGIRRGNIFVKRFRLSLDRVLQYCEEFYRQGITDIFFESGEDSYLNEDAVSEILLAVRKRYPDLTVYLSLGEKNNKALRHWNAVGAQWYVMSHGSANEQHFRKIFPSNMSPLLKKQVLWELRETGYKVGTGFLVGMPYQTIDHVAEDILFLKSFLPDMISIGTFLSVPRSPFESQRSGNGEMTLFIMAILRLMLPNSHVIAETSIENVLKNGRIRSLDAGADMLLVDGSDITLLNQYGAYERKSGRFVLSADNYRDMKAQLLARNFSV